MDDDIIVVDDVEPVAGPSNPAQRRIDPTTTSDRATRSRTGHIPRRNSINSLLGITPSHHNQDASGAPRKLKLKLGEKAQSQMPGTSFLGPYDRELDSDDEDLHFEEQFVLRMPHGEDCDRLRKAVNDREVGNDIWFKFKDSRRGVFHIGNSLYTSKLVDLPCVIESQKTLNSKQMFKVADICQMLVVENKIPNEDALSSQKAFNIDDFIWQHGISPPLHWARKRRFRKRVNKRTIETVEQEVERLLESDLAAAAVERDVFENINPDLPDSAFVEPEREGTYEAETPGPGGSDMGDARTPGEDLGDGDEEQEDDDEGGDGDIDEELAAELDLALEAEAAGEDEDGEDRSEDEDDEDDESGDDDDEDDDDPDVQARRLLAEEIRDLETAVAKKQREIASSANPLIKRRFEDALAKFSADLETKLAQQEQLLEKQRLKKAGIIVSSSREGSHGEDGVDFEGADEEDMGDALFGPEDDAMEMG